MNRSVLFTVAYFTFFVQNSFCDIIGNSFNVGATIQEILKKVDTNELSLNSKCAEQLWWFLENLASFDQDSWAVQMIDASAKWPSGILEVNTGGWLGSYDECLSIKSTKKDVLGNYCLGSFAASNTANVLGHKIFVPNNNRTKLVQTDDSITAVLQMLQTMIPFFGICVPNQCSGEEIESVLSIFNSSVTLVFQCQTKEDIEEPLDGPAIATIIGFGFFVVLMALSTMYDLHSRYFKKGSPHTVLLAFSVYTNGKKVFSMTKGENNELSCLHGIRFLSMLWVIMGHTFLNEAGGLTVNYMEVFRWLDTEKSMIFINGVYSVDTFLVVTGLLVVYTFIKAMNQGHSFNIFIFYLHRYLRLTPSLLAVVIASMTLIRYMGTGPLRNGIITELQDPCRKYWWSTILYLQNYVNMDSWCVGQTWYLNVDWQLYLISPIFLLPLYYKPIIGVSLTCLAMIGVMCTSYIITWNNQLAAILISFAGDTTEASTKFYLMTHTRAAPWFIGALTGYFIGRNKFYYKLPFLKMNKWLVLIMWAVVLTLVPVCIFAGHDELITSTHYYAVTNALYNTFAKPVWACCIAWIIFACVNGYGGIINHILSLSIFQVLNRFIYSMYLVHLSILYIILYSVKIPGYFSIVNIALSFWGIFMVSFGLSIFCVLAFESPTIVLEKYFLNKLAGRSKNEKRKVTESNHNEEVNVTEAYPNEEVNVTEAYLNEEVNKHIP